MRTLLYSINVTLDGCCDHEVGNPTEALHRHHAANLERADALLFGRITYQMMEEAWRLPESGVWPEWMPEWMTPFAETIDQAKKYVVSTTLDNVDWNSELVRGHLASFVRALKEEPGDIVQVGGVTLPITLANLGLIDEYEFVVQPIVAGHGPRLLEGLRQPLDLQLVDRSELDAGTTVLRYRPGGSAG